MNHTPTPYKIEVDTDPITILGRDGMEVIAHCGSSKIPSNHRKAAFIVRACNAHDDLVEALEMLMRNFEEGLPLRSTSYRQAVSALKLARGE